MDESTLALLLRLILIGVGVYLVYIQNRLRTKPCPECKRRVNSKSPTCRYCGYHFPGADDSRWSKPFYED